MNLSRLFLGALFWFACAGLAGAQADLGSIKRIAIDPQIAEPEIPLIQGPGNFKAFMLGGGIGVAIDQQTAGNAFREYMRRNHIDLPKIVHQSFKTVLEEQKILADGAADATLKLAINNYGFGAAGFFAGDDRRPLMNVTASLVSGAGNVVWTKTDYLTNLSKLTDVYTYDQLAANPQLTVKSLGQVSLLVAREILSDLKQ
jgi:hypothetical protein